MSNSRTRTRTTGPSTWAGAVRNPWTVLCVAATVVLGPAAATASALDQANKAPLHHVLGNSRPEVGP
ncbi:hypothetical protein ACFYZJ_04010 [Streptomyces sp. NPDC001848]|uniref:hypothetical protein n=1 Tax=Streptomyces sp. NPDC001848 TaxID=3364618 RepID=UPI00367C5A2F